jgi:DNA-binding response OmpR family regulator
VVDGEQVEVLVVDDDPDVRGMLTFTLGALGFSVREAKDGHGALDELEQRAPDCMVLDLMMPGLDGFGVLERMRARSLAPHTKVMILTGKTDERSITQAWELGAHEYLTKPADPDVIADTITRLGAGPPPD